MKMSRLIAFSICLNALLGAVLIWPGKVVIVPVTNIAPVNPAHETTSGEISTVLLDNSQSAALDIRRLTPFLWSQLESADYRVYASNLRAVGCPEATVGDIIIPDVNEVFNQRVKQLVDTVQYRFWEMLADQKAFEAMVDEKHKQLDDLQKEQDSMIQELLGTRANHRTQKDELAKAEQIDQRKQFLDFLPAEKITRCLALDAKFEALRDELNNADPPLESKELQSRSKHLIDEQKNEFEALLSPDELAEYKLRNSKGANLRFQLNGLDATEAEVKEMVRAQEVVASQTRKNTESQQRDAIKNILGADRFLEYERALDNRFQEFYQVADRYDLPTQKATQAYEIRTAAEAAVQQVRRDTSVSDDQRNTQLLAIRRETESALTEAFGISAFQTYQARSGQWLTALTNMR
jgi:hypothetical protein